MREEIDMTRIAFGMMRLPLFDEEDQTSVDFEHVDRMVELCMEKGVNFFDSAYPYHFGESEKAIKRAVVERYPRDSYIVSDKFPTMIIQEESQLQPIFDEQLERTGLDYFDYYMVHNVSEFSQHGWKDIDSFSLTLLQIQATIGTLVIAIIALITGNISDSYMGVPISKYYLSIRPWKFTQKNIMLTSLTLTVLSASSYVFKMHNIVFFLFVATVILVILSINGIYVAFRGKREENAEIEAYIDYILESESSYEKKLDIYENFVIDWKNIIDKQDKESREKYFGIYQKCFTAVCKFDSEEGIVFIQQLSYGMVHYLLGADSSTLKEKGISFLQEMYLKFWNYILIVNKSKESFKTSDLNQGFHLFSEIYGDLIDAVYDLDAEKVEKVLELDSLLEYVHRVMIWFRNDSESKANKNDKVAYNNELHDLCAFAIRMGYYLSKQKQKSNIINKRYWMQALERWSHFSTYNIPENRIDDFSLGKCKVYFGYCYGMFMNGLEDIVVEGLYLSGMSNLYSLDHKYQALLYLLNHCYLYYLAEREGEDCVSKERRQYAKNILYNGEVKKSFDSFLSLLSEHEDWIDPTLPVEMKRILDRYELFPPYGGVKSMILEYVIDDFYLFIVLYMNQMYYMPELLKKNIDDMSALRLVTHESEERTKHTFFKLYQLISCNTMYEEQIHSEVDLLYDSLRREVKTKQKERYIKLAKDEQKKYEETINVNEICAQIRENAIAQIKDKFSPIMFNDTTDAEIHEIPLLSLLHYTSSIGEKTMDGLYKHLLSNLLLGIERLLYQKKIVHIKSQNEDFSNEEDYINYLESFGFDVFLGSEYTLTYINHRFSTELKEYIRNHETIFTSAADGIVLKKDSFKICLHDVNVSIYAPSIKDSGAKYNEDTAQYSYSILEGLPIDFTEQELREFLYNNRKVIKITAKVSLQINEEIVGTIITRKK